MLLTLSIGLVSVSHPLSSYAQTDVFFGINNELKEFENDTLNPNSLEYETACSILVKLTKEVFDIYNQRVKEITEKLRGDLTEEERELLTDELSRLNKELNSTIEFIRLISRIACGS
jgi:methyl-accepting chemotaxis protein